MTLSLVPEPRKIELTGGKLHLDGKLSIVLDSKADGDDRFAAEYLAECLKRDFGIRSALVEAPEPRTIPVRLARRQAAAPGISPEGYLLRITPAGVEIEGSGAAGVYYATQTLRQCIERGPDNPMAPCLAIDDWPALKHRAMHYDTKHHQDKYEYVEDFIRELAHYKANVLVWEWEDKFEYRSHPEVGAPGAFTMDQMKALSRLARCHHVQIIPLIQGLGHVSFILKHPQNKHLREIPDSDWEFCPLKDGSYQMLFDLWSEAMEATPGSEFLHIGSDETYELGLGVECGCKARADETGKDGLMQVFIRRCVEFVESKGRRALSWGGRWKAGSKHLPPKGMVFVDSGDPEYLTAAKAAGYAGWIYAPNPGIEPLVMTHFPWVKYSMWRGESNPRRGTFADTALTVGKAARAASVEGSITTSWDDSGLHNQMWMLRFVCAAEFSWNPAERDLDEWSRGCLLRYYGPDARDMRECHAVLQDSAQFFEDTFQRRVWHWGDIGKIHLPDFPREGLEYSSFWRGRYANLLQRAEEERTRLGRALAILDDNLARKAHHSYDLEIMRTCAELMLHNAELILMLGELETAVGNASDRLHYADRRAALAELRRAEKLIADHLEDREKVYRRLVKVWEKTRLPKGMSTPEKKYFYARERARHFANRTPDMRYLVLDEDLLDLEGYLKRLRKHNEAYEKHQIGV